MARRTRKKPKPAAAIKPKPKPSKQFHLMIQDWKRIKTAIGNDGHIEIENVIRRMIEGKRSTEQITIDVNADSCAKIALSCARSGLSSIGYRFATAASSFETPKKEPTGDVDPETMERVRGELELLNNERD